MKKDIYIADIYRKKIDTIAPDVTVEQALQLFDQKHANAFIVINKQREPMGILSIEEIASALLPYEFKNNISIAKAMYKIGFFVELCEEMKTRKVAEIMRKDFMTVDLKTNILSLIGIFLMSNIAVIPVLEGKKIIGIVSKNHVKKAIQQAFCIQ